MSAQRKTIYSASTFEKSLSFRCARHCNVFRSPPNRHKVIEAHFFSVATPCHREANKNIYYSGCTTLYEHITRYYVFSLRLASFCHRNERSPLLIHIGSCVVDFQTRDFFVFIFNVSLYSSTLEPFSSTIFPVRITKSRTKFNCAVRYDRFCAQLMVLLQRDWIHNL